MEPDSSKSNSICFISNYEKTYFFDAVATLLVARGVKVHWIVVNRKLRDFLVADYGQESVLYISKDNVSLPQEAVGDFRLNELVYGDRALRYQPEWAYSFLGNIQKPIYEFIQRNNIKFIFGEITWAHEVLIHRLVTKCPELEAEFYSPQTIRIPVGRFGFFRDEFQSELVAIPDTKNTVVHETAIRIEKPDYLALNDVRLKHARTLFARLSRLKRYLTMENIDSSDPTLLVNRWLSFKINAKEEINRDLYNFVPTTRFDEVAAGRDFVFLALHKQPETSIDVIGLYYDDQYTNILNIWRSLPDGWWLYVKEHTNAVGDRTWWFYRKLRRLKNVLLIKETTDSHEIIRRARAVATVSGTVAYEAALMGVPSVTFGDVFFNRIPACRRIGLDHLRAGGLGGLINNEGGKSGEEFAAWLLQNSAEGIISDPISDKTCMLAENVEKVSRAIIAVIDNKYA